MTPVRKKFLRYSETGLGISPSGHYYVPHKFTPGEAGGAPGMNNFGFPYVEVGDYAVANLPSNRLTANTVGRTIHAADGGGQPGGAMRMEAPTGKKVVSWRYGAYVLSEQQMQEFLRTLPPEQITVPWARELAKPLPPPTPPGPLQTVEF